MCLDKGEHVCPKDKEWDRSESACIRDAKPVAVELGTDVGDVVFTLLFLLLFFFLARKLYRLWRRIRPSRSTIDRNDALPAGRLMGTGKDFGDLGWGSKCDGFLIPRDALSHHIVMAGGTGSGKTNSAEVLEFGAAVSYRPQIIHLDCKGSRRGMKRFLALMHSAGIARVRLFPVDAYDGWRGDARALLARLVQIQDWSESYYAAGTKDLLQRTLSTRTPTNSEEFVTQLERLASTNGDAKLIAGAQARYRGFFNSLDGKLDGAWAYEDCDACYLQLEGFGLPSEANALGRFLLEDLTHYLSERKEPSRQVLLVLDEFSAISQGADAANLIERAREFGCGVILTTQSYAGLGEGAERVLDAARGALIVHSLANPEPFTRRAGTVMREATSVTTPQNQPGLVSGILFGAKPETARTTTRLQEFDRIDPNEVRQLPRGEAYVISAGRAQRVAFDQIDLDEDELARAELAISQRLVPMASASTNTESDRVSANLDF